MLCIIANTWLLVLNYTGTSQCAVFKQYGEKGQKGQGGNPSIHSVPCIHMLERMKMIAVLKQDLEVVLERKCRSQCLNLSLLPQILSNWNFLSNFFYRSNDHGFAGKPCSRKCLLDQNSSLQWSGRRTLLKCGRTCCPAKGDIRV